MILFAATTLLALSDSCVQTRQFSVPSPEGHVLAAEVTSVVGSRRPAVILISGAGPHTRTYSTDAGSREGGNNAFRVFTAALVKAGYSVVTFDERGTGLSTGDYVATATTTTLADDVEAIARALTQAPEVDGDRIILLGHSEGSPIATIVASRLGSVRAAILLSAPAWGGHRIIAAQRKWQVEDDRLWSPGLATAEKRAAVLDEEHAERTATEPWYRHFLDFDPLSHMARVHVPVLILQGADDWKISPDQGPILAETARRAGNKRVKVRTFPGLGHSFGTRGLDGHEGPFSPDVVLEVLDWLKAQRQLQPTRATCLLRP